MPIPMIAYSVVETGPLAENCYLVWGEGKQAWIIDPGADFPLIEQEVAARGLTPVCVVLTHGHFDHLGASPSSCAPRSARGPSATR